MTDNAIGMLSRMLAPLRRRGLLLVAAGAFTGFSLADTTIASAQDGYPSRPITLVIGFGTGGGNDLMGRYLASKMSEKLGQTVVVENRTGAGGNIGAHSVAVAKPDGYTLFFGTNGTQAMNQFVFKDMPYDTDTAFVNVAFVARIANVLMINPALPPTTMAEFIEYIKQRPGAVRFGSGGVGAMSHLAMELVAAQAGVKMVHVPYRGAAEMELDVIAGHIDVAFDNINNAIPLKEAGQLRALGVTTAERWFALPDVPAINETLPGFEAVSWQVVVAPAGTEPAIVDKLHTLINEILSDETVKAEMRKLGVEPAGGTIEELDAFVKAEALKWRKIIADAGITAQ